MKKIVLLMAFFLLPGAPVFCDDSWGDILDQAKSVGNGIADTCKGLGSAFAAMGGVVPAGHYYWLRVFNGTNTQVSLKLKEAKEIMGMRIDDTGSGTTIVAAGSSSDPIKKDLYFQININPGGFSENHYTLGAKNDDTVYFYHAFQNKDTGKPTAELLGGGYITSKDFSGVINCKASKLVPFSFTLLKAGTARKIDIMLDSQSFNYLVSSQGYSLRPSSSAITAKLECGSLGSILIASDGIAQKTSKDGVPKDQETSNPSTYNYVVNDQQAFETGMGPGGFDQPQTSKVLRDITPVLCEIYNQPTTQAGPLGDLFPIDIAWESLWYVYEGSGWSQEKKQVISIPTGKIPTGSCASCMLIRPSIAIPAQRLFIVRLTTTDSTLAQQFLTKLVQGKLSLSDCKVLPDKTMSLVAKLYQPGPDFPAYPAFSGTALSGVVNNNAFLSPAQRAMVIPDSLGRLEDTDSHVQGYIIVSDVFTSYGTGSGPFYYMSPPSYLDVSQMLGTLINYIVMCKYAEMTSDKINSLLESTLPDTVMGWIAKYFGNPSDAQDPVTKFLLDNGKSGADTGNRVLSTQGQALLKMLLYGPCSISQAPVCYQQGTIFQGKVDGWPAVSVEL